MKKTQTPVSANLDMKRQELIHEQKEYKKPEMSIISYENDCVLLAGSGEDDPYWKPPEEKEGCETPWWCP